ncbi:flagellar protein FlaG [Kineothrix alysoides]|uniref:Flagellar protein FlaG n=1 Tax=Kineothrix alysoides TaxID=1469948 RepID=A0A4R1QNZ9_9FIRM|nr:flagellar protein FlaG [Kineothrix alysoides]TCL54015.1 flagellar protein FlaG [Kineothrix alysoides]
MAMDSLGSIRNIQTQVTQKPVVENTEVSSPDASVNVSVSAAPAAKTENKDAQNTGADNRDMRQAENDKIKKAVEQLNKKMPHSEAIFGIHDETNRVMIKIVDRDTKEVIREFPPEETLDMIAKVWELAGILVDEKR